MTLVQRASQGFAAGNPADVLYVSTDQLAGWAGNGSLYPYGNEMPNKDDFYPNLVQAFTVNGKLSARPRTFHPGPGDQHHDVVGSRSD